MVNTGKPSQGCFACRDRRVKCDMRKPYCQRCISLRRCCPGFPDEWTVVHRRQNEYAQKQVQVRVQRRIQERQKTEAIVQLPLLQNIDISADVQSLAQFHRDYSLHSGMMLFDVFSSSLASDPTDFCQHAVRAVSLASSARQHCQPILMAEARKHYGKAISAANAALQDLTHVEDSSLLTGLFLSGMFEIIVADQVVASTMNSSKTCHPHAKGALALLQFRAQRQLFSDMDKGLFAFISHVTLMEIFTSPDTDMQMWFDLDRFTSSWTAGVSLDLAIRQAVVLCMYARSVEAQPDGQVTLSELETSVESGFKIAEDLETLANQIGLLTSDQLSGRNVFNGLFGCSTKTTRTIAKGLYRTVRLHILEITHKLLIKMEHAFYGVSETSGLRSLCQARIITTLEEICEDIRVIFAFDDREMIDNQPGMPYRGFWMLWPLSVVLFSPFAEERQKSWAQNTAQSIGELTGIGLALLVARRPSIQSPIINM